MKELHSKIAKVVQVAIRVVMRVASRVVIRVVTRMVMRVVTKDVMVTCRSIVVPFANVILLTETVGELAMGACMLTLKVK